MGHICKDIKEEAKDATQWVADCAEETGVPDLARDVADVADDVVEVARDITSASLDVLLPWRW